MTDGPPDPPEQSAETLPTPLLELRDGLPPVASSQSAIDQAAARLAAGTGPLAVDAERASGYRYSQRAYLVQLRREGAGTVLIDPLVLGDVPNEGLHRLADALVAEEWIIHAASQDLPCLAQLGMRPTRLFDTELAGRLLNYPRVALGVLVEELLGFTMRKEHSAVDWSKRPLPESWLRYAALDVEVLVELRDVLADQLDRAGKTEWARQEFAAWADSVAPSPRAEPWRRTSGIHRVRGRRGLAIVREMWLARDTIAQERDIAPSKVLRDTVIVEAAQASPASRTLLSRLPGFASRGAQRYVRDFAAAVSRALSLRDAELPALAARPDGPPPARVWAAKFPVAAVRLGGCRERVLTLAAELDLPQENLLEPDVVRRLAWSPPDPSTAATVGEALAAAGARPWQVAQTAAALAEVLNTLG